MINGLSTIKINFRGGIISPGDLYNICVAAGKAGALYIRFGLRQQLLLDVQVERMRLLKERLDELGFFYETERDEYPNIMSSYPAEEVFIHNTWLSEGVYRDILDGMNYQPKVKINISDSNQSFTPMLTGNINWVAAADVQHFWHLFIRFPKTNTICEWSEMVYTNDVPRLSQKIESLITAHADRFIDNAEASGEELFSLVDKNDFILKPAAKPAVLPAFNLPYYEGLNRYNNKYWLGIYRRDEQFRLDFVKEACRLCLDTKIGQLCSTPWKTIIIKGIEEKDKWKWNELLEKHQVNMRHAANELNFQVEDNSFKALEIKNYLAGSLGREDTRTFGACIGIKTKRKSEVFSSILVRRRPLIRIFGLEFFHLYDVLCARDFNPNERTGFVFSRFNPKFLLAEQLRRCILAFYAHKASRNKAIDKKEPVKKEVTKKRLAEYVYQCRHCLSIYDEAIGEPDHAIQASTPFNDLPESYCCQLCEAGKTAFEKTEKNKLGLETI
jgi:rubredoxin